ncbi:MAG: adenylyl-sulfate kinase [Burkholderiales bacterium]
MDPQQPKSTNIFTVLHRVAEEQRTRRNAHRCGIVWFTGLSASGKSTLAVELERVLYRTTPPRPSPRRRHCVKKYRGCYDAPP